MAKTAQEIDDQANEVVVEVLEIVEDLEKTNNSFFRRVPKHAITYLLETVRQLCITVLNLSKTAASAERLIQLKDAEIDTLRRENLKLGIETEQLRTQNGYTRPKN